MLALKTTESVYFDLPADAALDITGSNPAFDADAISRVFSYPFLLPSTPRNLRILKHANRLDAKRRTSAGTSVPVRLDIAGSVSDGFLNIGDVSDRLFECSFGNLSRQLLDTWNNIKIRDLMPTITVPQINSAGWLLQVQTTGLFPIYYLYINDVQYAYTVQPADSAHDVGTALAALINADYPGSTFLDSSDILNIDPAGYDPFNISNTMQGLTLVSALTIGQALQANMLLHVQTIIDTPVATHCFPTMAWDGFYAGLNPLYIRYVNYWHGGVQGENEPSALKEWAHTYVPFVRAKYIFDQIAAASGLSFTGAFYNSDDFFDACVFSNYAVDFVRQDYIVDNIYYLNCFLSAFNLANSVPDLSARDYIFLICEFFNLYPDEHGTDIILKRRRDQLTAPKMNFSDWIDPAYKMTIRPQRGVTLRFLRDPADGVIVSDQLDDYTIGTGEIIQEVKVSPIQEQTLLDSVTDTYWRLCHVRMRGSSGELDLGTTATPLRLFFNRGEQLDADALAYQMSSHLDTAMDDSSTGDLSMEWDGANGLYEQLWKGWAELPDKQPLEMSAVVPVSVATGMLRWEHPVIRFYHPMGETSAIVKTIQFDISNQTSESVRINLEMIKL